MSDIKTITEEEFNNLTDLEKQDWVLYHPSLQSEDFNNFINSSSHLNELLTQASPLLEKMNPITGGSATVPTLPLSVIVRQIESIQSSVESMYGHINAIASHKYASICASPLMMLYKLVGLLGGMVYSLYMVPQNFTDSFQQAYNQVDMDTLKDKLNNKTIPEINSSIENIKKLDIPDPDIKAYIDNITANMETSVSSANTLVSSADSMGQSIPNLGISADQLANAATLGTSSFIGNVTDAQKINFSGTLDPDIDPKTQVTNINTNLNNLMNNLPVKYIKSTDLEQLKNNN